MKAKIISIFVMTLLITVGSVAVADWDPEDGHKMHWPQTPDPNGWDVYCTAGLTEWPQIVLADDWECSETGWVKDIHLWGSRWHDNIGIIDHFVIGIAENIPENPPQNPYSKPGETLIEWEIFDWVERGPYNGNQGWYWSYFTQWDPDDHQQYWQYNFFLNEEDWFWQEEGKIYWLFVSAIVKEEPIDQPLWGWKSTFEYLHFMDDAVWAYWNELYWIPLEYPTGFTMDLAFVITGGEACDPGFDVEKYVRDPVSGNWVDADTIGSALDLKIGTIAEFKIVANNTGTCTWTEWWSFDTMEDSLKPVDPPLDEWNYSAPYYTLNYTASSPWYPGVVGEWYIKAEVVGAPCHTDYNKIKYDVYDLFSGSSISDEDYAYVHCVKKSKELDISFLNFLQKYPNLFPILRYLLGL